MQQIKMAAFVLRGFFHERCGGEIMTNSSQSWGLTVLRVVIGIVFLMHGGQKLFVWGIHGVAGFLGQIGIPLPNVAAVLLTLVEVLSGAALVLGLLTRWAALLLAIDMAVAILALRLKGGFFAPNGCEYELTLLTANVALALSGPGAASVDGAIAKRN
jgi:putative oxidoreductase